MSTLPSNLHLYNVSYPCQTEGYIHPLANTPFNTIHLDNQPDEVAVWPRSEEPSQHQLEEEVIAPYYYSTEPSFAPQFSHLPLHEEESYHPDPPVTIFNSRYHATSESEIAMGDQATGDGWAFNFPPSPLPSHSVLLGEGIDPASWPWGNHSYRPSTPMAYLDPTEYIMADQVQEVEDAMREQWAEFMAQQAMREGARGREERDNTSPFSYTPGRTIYTPPSTQ